MSYRTGETLLGPGNAESGKQPLPITVKTGKWEEAERESEGVEVAVTTGTDKAGESQGLLLHRCMPTGEGIGECQQRLIPPRAGGHSA